ncbi:MAG: hypothetical protein HOV81_11965 [Kofleriaceae bacterium]|nr:hypothetical protein [Kofleriaceae bacterium]
MTLDVRLAQARADQRELAWVKRRLAEARTDRERVTEHLEVAEKARGYEDADGLTAAQLLCDELADELRAVDAYIAELTARAARVADADARYAAALAEAEDAARVDGALDEELDTLAVAEADLGWRRVELGEVIAIGIGVQKTFVRVVDLVRELSPQHYVEPMFGEHLFPALTGKTQATYSELTASLAHATHGLRQFTRACAELSTPTNGLEPQFDALPSVDSFVLRDVVWTNRPALESLLPEISRVSSTLAATVGELRAREASLASAVAECARMRARLLDPASVR